MKHWYAQDLSPQKQEYLQWRHTTASVQEADHAFNRLKQLSGAIVFAREAEDPNAVPFLRDIALPMLIRHAKDPNAITGPHVSPREKNVDVLWQGYKRFLREKAAFSQKRLDQYVAENDIPHMIVRLASDMTRGETYIALYETAMAERTPKEARDLHQRVLAVCRELAEFLPEWNALMAMADGETKKILEEVRTDIVDSISPSDN
jgi:hypothetical protein